MTKPEPHRTDPEDRQFGAAAADKEEALDEAIDQGTEQQLSEKGKAAAPRPGSKAVPDQRDSSSKQDRAGEDSFPASDPPASGTT